MTIHGEGDYLLKNEHYERHCRLAKILAEQGEFENANYHFDHAREIRRSLERWRQEHGAPRW